MTAKNAKRFKPNSNKEFLYMDEIIAYQMNDAFDLSARQEKERQELAAQQAAERNRIKREKLLERNKANRSLSRISFPNAVLQSQVVKEAEKNVAFHDAAMETTKKQVGIRLGIALISVVAIAGSFFLPAYYKWLGAGSFLAVYGVALFSVLPCLRRAKQAEREIEDHKGVRSKAINEITAIKMAAKCRYPKIWFKKNGVPAGEADLEKWWKGYVARKVQKDSAGLTDAGNELCKQILPTTVAARLTAKKPVLTAEASQKRLATFRARIETEENTLHQTVLEQTSGKIITGPFISDEDRENFAHDQAEKFWEKAFQPQRYRQVNASIKGLLSHQRYIKRLGCNPEILDHK